MMIEPGRPATIGWLTLGGSIVVTALLLYFLQVDEELANSLELKRQSINQKNGAQTVEARLKAEGVAVEELGKTIKELKDRMGFTVQKYYRVAPDEQDEKLRQPGYLFKQRLVEVRGSVRKIARNKSITFDDALGFDSGDVVPPDSDAPFLLTMLQLTNKAANIVLTTPSPVTHFSFKAIRVQKPIETGSANNTVLLREFPLQLTVEGGLEDILSILHRLSKIDEKDANDYPLVLQRFSIDSQNFSKRDDIVQLKAVFDIVGMQFLSPEERQRSSGANPSSGTKSSTRPPTSGSSL